MLNSICHQTGMFQFRHPKNRFFGFSYKITLNSCTSCNGVVQFIRWYGLFMQSTITFGKKQFVLFTLWLSRQLYLSSGCWRIAYAVCSLCWRIIKIDQKTEIWYSNCVGVSSLFLWFHRVCVWAMGVVCAICIRCEWSVHYSISGIRVPRAPLMDFLVRKFNGINFCVNSLASLDGHQSTMAKHITPSKTYSHCENDVIE